MRDRLRALRWDGVPRVRNALHHFLGTEVNDYHERCLRTFMLGAVKRVFQPGCKFELMLVLVGGQGAGKSHLPAHPGHGAGLVLGRPAQPQRQGRVSQVERAVDH